MPFKEFIDISAFMCLLTCASFSAKLVTRDHFAHEEYIESHKGTFCVIL